MVIESDDAISLNQVLGMLEPERTEVDRFRGRSLNLGWGYMFGGQLVAQALSAAEQTVRDDQAAHSLHGYFLEGGDESKPVTYEVIRMRDGKSFASRRVDAVQEGRAVFTLTASFHREQSGLEHQEEMPQTRGPEDLPSQIQLASDRIDRMPEAAREQMSLAYAIDIRPVDPTNVLTPEAKPPVRSVWYRALGKLPDRPEVHRALLAYLSDLHLLSVAMRPHSETWFTPGLRSSSLDHALWFHRPFRIDEWLLFIMDSPSANGARAFARGRVFTQDGVLVASVAQEGLIRVRS